MPFSERQAPPVEAPSPKVEQAPVFDVSRMAAKELAGYKEWKGSVPLEIRSLVEGHLMGKKIRVDADGFPSVVEFQRAMRQALQDPRVAPETLGVSEVVERQVKALQGMKIGEEMVNVFAALTDPNIGFGVKANYVQTKLLPRLEFLCARDARLAEKARKEKKETDVSGEDEEEEYAPHRAPTQESEGLPSEAVATVSPFFGGYMTDAVFDAYDPATLTWKTSGRVFGKLPEQAIDEERVRVYRSRAKNGRGAVKLPRGWGVDSASMQWSGEAPSDWSVEADQNGVVRVKTASSESAEFSVRIGPSKDTLALAPPKGDVPQAQDAFPAELLDAAQAIMAQTGSDAVKARRIASTIHKHLEYDTDAQWEAVYKADPARYFEEIWKHKKAKCDEANTLLVRLLTKAGMHARFVGGHSVRTKSSVGEAMLLESNRHAWCMAWDAGAGQWIRLDATPAGDPNVDQEEQQEELGEGDYGEQEAELMSEEELEKRLEDAQEQETQRAEREDPVLAYAREAECSPEEARAVLQKIDALRETYSRVLSDADRQWHKLVRENIREKIVDRGPVAMSHMDEIDPDELVAGYIEVRAGERDPLLGEREEIERTKEKWFGGYEVYIATDMSDSMNETINGIKKVEAQRDMAFLLVDSCMTAAVSVRQKERQLKAPMPVKVSVCVFGTTTEIVLPLTSEWGPKEQIKLYRALDAGAGGGTPDHAALALLKQHITESAKEEEAERAKKPTLKKHGWSMRRFVIATADGGSDQPAAVKKENEVLKDAGIPVDLFLLSPEGDEALKQAAEASYQSVTPVSDVNDLAQKGLARLTERIREAYGAK